MSDEESRRKRSVLDEHVLILNRNWQPIAFHDVQTAIVAVTRDHASVLHPETYALLSFDEWAESGYQTERVIRTPTMMIPAPEVTILVAYGERPPRGVSFSKPNLSRRDGYACQYCGERLPERKLQIEHVLPRSRGGATNWENCVAACGDCNQRKANKTPQEAGMRLKTQPRRPTWSPSLKLPYGTPLRDAWIPFLRKEAVVA